MKLTSVIVACVSAGLYKRQETNFTQDPVKTVLYTVVNGTFLVAQPTQETSDVTLTTSDVTLTASDVTLTASDVTLTTTAQDSTATVGVLETVFDTTTTEEITATVAEVETVFSQTTEVPEETQVPDEPQVQLDFCTLSGFSAEEISNGTQQVTSTCSLTPLGAIPSFDKMISTIITFPLNGAIIPFGTNFTVNVFSSNIDFGFFDDPQTEYYLNPQSLNEDGLIKGHTHVTIEKIINPFQPLDARFPAFFRGLNGPSVDGSLSVEVDGSAFEETGPGDYRICTITASSSHAPVLMPVARRGSQDDCIRVVIV